MTRGTILRLAREAWGSRSATRTDRLALMAERRAPLLEQWRAMSVMERSGSRGLADKLVRRRCTVGIDQGIFLSIRGQGDTWEEAARSAGLVKK